MKRRITQVAGQTQTQVTLTIGITSASGGLRVTHELAWPYTEDARSRTGERGKRSRGVRVSFSRHSQQRTQVLRLMQHDTCLRPASAF